MGSISIATRAKSKTISQIKQVIDGFPAGTPKKNKRKMEDWVGQKDCLDG